MHYAFGASSAAVYGALLEVYPWMSFGYGMGFGTAVWLGADEARCRPSAFRRALLNSPRPCT